MEELLGDPLTHIVVDKFGVLKVRNFYSEEQVYYKEMDLHIKFVVV